MKLIQFIDKQDQSQALRIGALIDGTQFIELQEDGTMRDLIRQNRQF